MKVIAWNIGWLVLACAWLGPLPELAETSFAAHMTLHMLVVAVAAPVLAIAMSGKLYDPVKLMPNAFPAIPASIVELLVVWIWHAPALHHWARHHASGFVLEQASFLASGLWIWLAAFGGYPSRVRSSAISGIAGLLLTSIHMTLLGALLAMSPRLLYSHVVANSHMTPLQDQHLGGAVMLVAGGIVYLSGGIYLTFETLRNQPATSYDPPTQQFENLPSRCP